MRLNANGTVDDSFDFDGISISDFTGWAIGAAVQKDGKIIVCFETGVGGFYTLYQYGLFRYNTDGSQDPNFMNNMGAFFSNYTIRPHAIALGGNQIYVAAELIQYPADKRQPIQEYPTLERQFIEAASSLPVVFTEFKLKTDGSTNVLEWETGTENNNSGFEVQSSRDAVHFSSIGFVPTKAIDGNSNFELHYLFVHNFSALRPGKIYYRLKQTDINGEYKYSNILSSNINSLDFLVYPNPARDKIILTLNSPEKFRFSINDYSGKIVKSGQLKTNVLNISDLPSGPLILKVWSVETSKVFQFVKE